MNSYKTLLQWLRELLIERRSEVKQEYSRVLPFGEYIVDRWDKAHALDFGEGSSVYDSAYVYGDVTVGENTWVGPFVILDGSGGLSIGSNCSISAGVQIYTHDSVKWATSGGLEPLQYSGTTIGNNCYIGPNCVISKGITVGEGCVIGANSVVLADVPAFSKVAGSPAVLKK